MMACTIVKKSLPSNQAKPERKEGNLKTHNKNQSVLYTFIYNNNVKYLLSEAVY